MESIKNILNIITLSPAYNHMLFSNNGGLDLRSAKPATEEGWLDLIVGCGYVYRIKPARLIFENFYENIEWNYFRLEIQDESLVLSENKTGLPYELLTEDYPAHYVDSTDSCYGVYDYDTGVPLPPGAKNIKRYVSGVFLIVMKHGTYDAINAIYDGRHGDCNNEQFRKYIEELIKVEIKLKSIGMDPVNYLNRSELSVNPFKKDEHNYQSNDSDRKILRDVRDYIRDNIMRWEFPVNDISVDYSIESPIFFYITYNEEYVDIIDYYENQEKILCLDGNFREMSSDNKGMVLYFYRQDEITDIMEVLNRFIYQKITAAGMDITIEKMNIFSIELKRGNIPPKHLFTREEIKHEMQNADDRRGNVLVVDGDGFVHVIPIDSDTCYYPASLEPWDARNNYVGKYSTLDTLDETYLMALECWHTYLSTGRKAYLDYTNLNEDSNIMQQIQALYNKCK